MDYSKKLTKDDAEYNLLGDIFKFYSKYYRVTRAEEYWQQLIAEADELVAKYNESMFSQKLVLAVCDELNRRAKELPKEDNTWIVS